MTRRRTTGRPRKVRAGVLGALQILVVVAILAISLVFSPADPASATSPFAPVFAVNAPGDITFVSNTLMTCNPAAGTGATNCIANGQNGNWANNNFTMVEVDVDGDPSTSNSSSNDLNLNGGANVLYAGLYWVGMASAANVFDPNIKLETPAGGGYTNIVADDIDNLGSRHYGAYADVTSLIQTGGNGTYTVGGADLLTNARGRYGGWTLVVAYEDNAEPWRNLTVFNGYDFVYNGNTPTAYNVPLTVSGFTAPPVGPVKASIGIQTGEGDARYVGPTTAVNGTQIFDAMNPVNNVQNSTISILGTPANTLADPSYPNQLGFDADIMDATGLIPVNSTSADLEFRSSGDVYGINVVTTAIEIYVPNLTSTLSKTGTDLNAEQTHPGDVIDYRVAFDNSGEDPATDVIITDLIPPGTTYVPNSLQIISDVGTTGPMTDAPGDDKAYFDSGSNRAVFHVGTGANPTMGGQVDPLTQGGQAHEVAFQVVVDSGTEFTTVANSARVDYVAKFLNEAYSTTTEVVEHDVLPLVDLTIEKSDDVDPVIAGNNVTYTVEVGNEGPSQADNVVITDTLPVGVTFVSGSGCSAAGSTLTCPAANIASGDTYSLDITVAVDGDFLGTSVTNLASVTSDTHEHNTSDNATKQATTVERQADLAITKSAPATIDAGTNLVYTLTAENLGDSEALNVELADPLPTGTSFVSSTADLGGTCDATVNCTWPSLAAGATSTITIVVAVPPTTADGTIITNSTKIGSSDPDPNESNNTDQVTTDVNKVADLAITKSAPATAIAGDSITYTVDVVNNGPSEAVNVITTDPVPSASYTFNPLASSSGCSLAAGDITCAAGTLAPSGSASFTIVFDIDSEVAEGTIVENEATVSSETDDPTPGNNTDDAETEIVRQADLFVQKDDNTTLAIAGGQLSYSLDYGNLGFSDATNVSIVDTLPAGVTFDAGLSDPACSPSGSDIICTIGTLVAGGSGSVAIVVDVAPSILDGASLQNTATISGTETDPNALNNETQVATPAERSAELQLTKADDVDPVLAGENIAYTVTVRNIGPSEDDNIVVTDTLPTGVTLVSAPGCSEVLGVVTCAVGTLAPSASASFVITVTTDAGIADGTSLTNSLAASGDVSPEVEISEETTVNTDADIRIDKTGPTSLVAGTSITYSIVVSNDGPSNATNVVVTDAFPTGTSYSSHSVVAGTGTCTATASGLNCSQGTLAPGENFSIDVELDVAENVASGSTVTNTALVSSDTGDDNPSNNTSTFESDVRREADLRVKKVAISPEVNAGEPATYQIVVANDGPSQATGVQVTDVLPTGFTFVAATSSADCLAGVTCTVPVALNTGDSFTFTVAADVGETVTDGTYQNAASVAANETDPDTDNNDASADVVVVTEADLSVQKTSDDLTFTPGTTETYSIVVTNDGPSAAQNLDLSDNLPTGLTFNPVGSSPECGIGITCSLATLAVGASATFTIAVDVDPSLTGSITNTVSLTSDTTDPDSSNNADNDPTPLVPEADLQITKSAAATVVAGQDLVYSISVTNAGPSDAQNVVTTDTLPPGVDFVSASAGCSEAAGVVTCGESSLAAAATALYTIAVAVPPGTAEGTVLTNEVDVTSDAYDPNLVDNGDKVETEVLRTANLTLSKTVLSPTGVAGESVTYTITVGNDGPSNAADVAVTDSMPFGMAASAVTTTIGSCLTTGTAITCSHPDLAPGDVMVITVTGVIDSSVADGTVLRNRAEGSTSTTETNAGDNAADVDVTIEARADLSVVKDSGVASVVAGEAISYTVTVTNDGPSDAQNVIVTDTMPPELVIGAVSPSPTCSFVGSVVTCNAGTIANDASFEITIDATVNENATDGVNIVNTATVSSDTTDPEPDNNSGTDTTNATKSADLALTKEATTNTISAGETLFYNLAVENLGSSSATNIVVSDTLPTGVVFNVALSNSNCAEAAGVVTCSFPMLAAGADIVFAIAVDLPDGLTDGVTLTNSASVQADEDDPVAANDDADDMTTVNNQADLSIVKDAEDIVVAGESLLWTLNVANSGPADAVNVVITDTLPADTSFNVAGSDSRCSVAGSTVTCNVATLAADATDSFVMEVDVASSVTALSSIVNTASIGSDTEDPDPSDNASTDSAPVERASGLSIIKTDLSDPVVAGEQVQWAVTVANAGPSDADNLTIADSVPSGFTFVSVNDTTNCSAIGDDVSCTFPTVVAGGSASIVITADVDTDLIDGSVHQNTATADSDSSAPVSDTEDTTVVRQSDLRIAKSSDRSVVAGTNHTYTVAVTNDGPSDADDVVVTDALPAGLTFVSDSLSGCVAVGAIITCDLGTIAHAGTVTFDLVVAVADSATNPTVNVALVDSDSNDPNEDNNTDDDSTEIDYQADLSLSKSAAPDPATPGQNITWTLTVSNDGPSIANNVVLTDVLPPGVGFGSASSGCSHTAGTVTCAATSILSGGQVGFTIVGTLDSDLTGTVANTASVTSDTPDPVASDNTTTEETDLTPTADLAMVKASNPDPITAGEPITYTLTVTNNGPSDATNVVVTDVLPSSLTVVSSAPAVDCSEVDQTVTCSAGTVAAGGTYQVTIVADLDQNTPDSSTLSNTATVTTDTEDPTPGNNSDTETTDVAKSADLSVTKGTGPTSVVAGQQLIYGITVANAGPSSATNIVVTDTLPPGVVYNPALSSSACSEAGGVVTCSFPLLTSGNSFIFNIVVDLPSSALDGSTLSNHVAIDGAEDDPESANDEFTFDIDLANEADLSIVKDIDGFAVAGESIAWDLDVYNAGDSDAINVVVADTLPTGTSFDAASSDSRCAEAGGIVTCNLSVLAADDNDTFTIVVDLASSLPDPDPITNSASVASDTNDPDPDDNTSSDGVPVERDSELSIVKADVSDPVVAGEQAQWTITVLNNGPSDADNVTIDDTLPAGFTLVSVDNTTNCSMASNSVACTFPTVANGDSVQILVTADVDTDLIDGSTHQNTATTASDSSDAVSDTEDTTVVRSSDLGVTKQSVEEVVAGTELEYVIEVANDGPSAADNVVVTDILPAGISYVSDSLSACTSVLGTVTCSLGTLADQATSTFTMVVYVDDAAGEIAVNNVVVDSDSADPDPDNNVAAASTDVTFDADLRLEKAADPDPVTPGENITWTLTVTNDGPSVANNVVVTDVLPIGASFVSASDACSNIDGTVTCLANSMAAADDLSFEIVATVDPSYSGSITNTASVASDTPDSDQDDNETSTVSATEASADLSMAKTLLTDPVVAGESAIFELTVSNEGPSNALALVITDELPSGMSFVWADPGCSETAGTIECTLAELWPDESSTFQVEVLVASTIVEGETLENTATVESAVDDPDETNDADAASATVTREAELDVVKTVLTEDPVTGAAVEWLIEITNVGPSQATNLVLLDSIGGEFGNVSADDPDCTVTPNTATPNTATPNTATSNGEAGNDVQCAREILDSGDTWPVQISATALNSSAGSHINVAEVESDNTAFVSGSVEFEVRTPDVDLLITKETSDTVTAVGDPVNWLIVVENSGEATATPVMISDTVPNTQDLVSVSSDDAECSVAQNVLSCTIASGFADRAEILVATKVLDVTGDISNSATAQLENGDTVVAVDVKGAAIVNLAPGPLAFTGTETSRLVLLALGFLAIGFIVIRQARRRPYGF